MAHADEFLKEVQFDKEKFNVGTLFPSVIGCWHGARRRASERGL